jgi:hypothetical protein
MALGAEFQTLLISVVLIVSGRQKPAGMPTWRGVLFSVQIIPQFRAWHQGTKQPGPDRPMVCMVMGAMWP